MSIDIVYKSCAESHVVWVIWGYNARELPNDYACSCGQMCYFRRNENSMTWRVQHGENPEASSAAYPYTEEAVDLTAWLWAIHERQISERMASPYSEWGIA